MIVHNPTDTAVRDYPIQDPKTKEVSLWGIEPGETLDFPDYVGSYLVEVYGFLQRVVTQEQLNVEHEEAKKLAKGKHFETVKIISQGGVTNSLMQDPAPTKEELQPKNNPAAQPEMVGAVVGDEADKASAGEIPVQQAKPSSTPSTPVVNPPTAHGRLVCPECNNAFQNKAALKTHYAHAHLKLAGID